MNWFASDMRSTDASELRLWTHPPPIRMTTRKTAVRPNLPISRWLHFQGSSAAVAIVSTHCTSKASTSSRMLQWSFPLCPASRSQGQGVGEVVPLHRVVAGPIVSSIVGYVIGSSESPCHERQRKPIQSHLRWKNRQKAVFHSPTSTAVRS